MNENLIKLELNLNQINIVLAGLGKVALEDSLETYTEIRKQVDPQVKKPEGPLADKVIN